MVIIKLSDTVIPMSILMILMTSVSLLACLVGCSPVGGVVGLDVVHEVVSGQSSDVFLGAEDGAAQASAHEGSLVQVVEDLFLIHFVDLHHLSQNHITLSFNSLLVHERVGQYIGEDLHGLGDIVFEHTCVVDGLFTRSVSIQMTSHVLNLHLELLLGALLCALERNVLQEMSDTTVSSSLVTATSINPHTYSGCLSVNGLARKEQRQRMF